LLQITGVATSNGYHQATKDDEWKQHTLQYCTLVIDAAYHCHFTPMDFNSFEADAEKN
jgi:hypothetical protein